MTAQRVRSSRTTAMKRSINLCATMTAQTVQGHRAQEPAPADAAFAINTLAMPMSPPPGLPEPGQLGDMVAKQADRAVDTLFEDSDSVNDDTDTDAASQPPSPPLEAVPADTAAMAMMMPMQVDLSGALPRLAPCASAAGAVDPRRASLDRAAAAFGGYEALAEAAAFFASSSPAPQMTAAAAACPPPGLEPPPAAGMSSGSLAAASMPLGEALRLEQLSIALSMQTAVAAQAAAARAMAAAQIAAAQGCAGQYGQQGRRPPAATATGPQQRRAAAAAADEDFVELATDGEGHAEVLRRLGCATKGAAAAERLRGAVLRLALDRHGCRVVQKALEVAPAELKLAFASELKGHVLQCAEHLHGNFVLQKLIVELPQGALGFILEEIQGHAAYAASHLYACRTVQRLLEKCSPRQVQVLVGRILRCVGKLAKDTYGNNILRQLLEHGGASDKRRIIAAMTDGVGKSARNQFSSLVLEKCLEVSSTGEHSKVLASEREALLRALLAPEHSNGKRSVLQAVALDKFGNYIVQRAIVVSRGEEFWAVAEQLQPLEAELKKSATGRHILTSMRRHLASSGAVGGGVVGGA